jgi:hypothetical protein
MDIALAWQSLATNPGPFIIVLAILVGVIWLVVNQTYKERLGYLRDTVDYRNELDAREMAAASLLEDQMAKLNSCLADLRQQIADRVSYDELGQTSSSVQEMATKMENALTDVTATWNPRSRRNKSSD